MAEWTTSGPGEGGLCEAAVFVVLECDAVGSGGEGAGDGSCGVCLVSPGVQDEGAVDVEAVSVVAADGEGVVAGGEGDVAGPACGEPVGGDGRGGAAAGPVEVEAGVVSAQQWCSGEGDAVVVLGGPAGVGAGTGRGARRWGLPRSGVTSDVWCWMAPLKGCSHAQAVSEGVPRGSGAGRSEP